MGGKKSGRIRNVREEDRKDLCFPHVCLVWEDGEV